MATRVTDANRILGEHPQTVDCLASNPSFRTKSPHEHPTEGGHSPIRTPAVTESWRRRQQSWQRLQMTKVEGRKGKTKKEENLQEDVHDPVQDLEEHTEQEDAVDQEADTQEDHEVDEVWFD